MEKECPKCKSIVEGVDCKGDGVCLTYICDECGYNFHEDKQLLKPSDEFDVGDNVDSNLNSYEQEERCGDA